MEIEFELTQGDLEAFVDYQFQNSPRVASRIRKVRIAYFLGFGLLALGLYMTGTSSTQAVIFAVIGFLLFIFAPKNHTMMTRRQVAQNFQDPANQLKYRKRKLRITHEGLDDSSELATSNIKWSAIQRVEKIPTHGFIYVTSDTAYIIPRSGLGDELFEKFIEEATEFWNVNRTGT